jgi:hypothetical protein
MIIKVKVSKLDGKPVTLSNIFVTFFSLSRYDPK